LVIQVRAVDRPGQLIGQVFPYLAGHARLLDDVEQGQASLHIIQPRILGWRRAQQEKLEVV
jgi:hypothetical protein